MVIEIHKNKLRQNICVSLLMAFSCLLMLAARLPHPSAATATTSTTSTTLRTIPNTLNDLEDGGSNDHKEKESEQYRSHRILVVFRVLGTFPRNFTFSVYFSFDNRIRCLGAIFLYELR